MPDDAWLGLDHAGPGFDHAGPGFDYAGSRGSDLVFPALGIDLGSKRIGVAKSDGTGLLASPYSVLARQRDKRKNHREIQAIVDEWDVAIVVVGLPLSLDGSVGPAAQRALKEVKQMGDTLTVPVEAYDERLTTVTAQEMLRGNGVKARDQKSVVDMVAAAVLLQSWLDRQRSVDHHGVTPTEYDL